MYIRMKEIIGSHYQVSATQAIPFDEFYGPPSASLESWVPRSTQSVLLDLFNVQGIPESVVHVQPTVNFFFEAGVGPLSPTAPLSEDALSCPTLDVLAGNA